MRSRSFEHDGLIPACHSRSGGNISPDLSWTGVPLETFELLLLVEDPDAARRILLHWLITRIDPACTAIEAGKSPATGRLWCNDFGEFGYNGPHPPVGDPPHRYFFRLFAIAGPVRLPRHPSAADVHRGVRGVTLASGALVGRYERPAAF